MSDMIKAVIEKHGLSIKAEFVPFSRSRNAKPDAMGDGKPWLSINWKVTLRRNGRDILTTDYSAGSAHCPGYNMETPKTFDRPARFWRQGICEWECENGVVARFDHWKGFSAALRNDAEGRARRVPILPKIEDVIYSLLMDASVLDCGGFEDWAAEFGYETDSRKAEKLYRDCLESALKLRSAIGESALSELREAFQDY